MVRYDEAICKDLIMVSVKVLSQELLRKITKNIIQDSQSSGSIRTRHLLITQQRSYHFANLVSVMVRGSLH